MQKIINDIFKGVCKMIKDFKIGCYRGILNANFKDLKRVNVFVGPNNCGKTSILEAIILSGLFDDVDLLVDTLISRYQYFTADFFKAMFPIEKEPCICLESTLNRNNQNIHTHVLYEEKKRISSTIKSEIFKIFTLKFHYDCDDVNDDNCDSFLIEFEETADGYNVKLGKNKSKKLINKIPCQFISFSRFDRSKRFSESIDEILDTNRRTELIDILQIFDENIENFEAIGKERNIKIFKKDSKESLSLYDYGNGMYKAFYIAASALLSQDGILLIDEIEAGIHSKALSLFIQRLLEVCNKNNIQLFLTTHSLEAIDTILNDCQNKINDIAVYHLQSTKLSTKIKRYSGERLVELRNDIGFDVR